MAVNDGIVWVDCEMTGLDIQVDELVEIAIVITDAELTPVDDGLQVVIRPSDEALSGMGDFVRTMHQESGLLEAIPDGVSVADAEARVLDYMSSHLRLDDRAPLAGNSIGTDRMFIAKFMKRLDQRLHYRNIDVSSIKELARRWYPRVYFNAPSKEGCHRALVDIRESVRELAYYRVSLFPSPPGPSSVEAQTAATAVRKEWASRM